MINNISFKGYDARELKGLMCTDKTCADAINRTLKNSDTKIDVFTPQIASKSIRKEHVDELIQNFKNNSKIILKNTEQYDKKTKDAIIRSSIKNTN